MNKEKLSSRERMLAAMRRQSPDFVPMSPYIGQGPWWKGELFWNDQIERTERMLALGLDPAIDIWLPYPEPHPDVTIKTSRDTSGDIPVITKEYHTPAGVLRQVVKESDGWCKARHGLWTPTIFGTEKRDYFGMELLDDYNVSRRLEPWVKGSEDLKKLRYIIRMPNGYKLDEWRMDAQRAMEIADKFGVVSVSRRAIVGDAFQWFCDIQDFLCQLISAPDFVKEFFDIFQSWSMELVQLALDVGVDVVQYRGWYEIPTYWGPNFFAEFLKPCIEDQGNLVHQAGKLFSYLLPEGQGAYADILATMNVDVLQGVDPRMLHGGNMKSLFAKTGDTKAFWGGVNAEVTLESCDAEQIDTAVKEAIDCLGTGGGLVLSSFLFPEVPQTAIMQMIESWKKYCNTGVKNA
ncbi:MAG: uroporphyrinogen decarboxylase family protein [Planctomycetota bacterium]